MISNIAPLNQFNVTINGTQINFTENYVTPTSAGVTVDGNQYTLTQNASYHITNTGGGSSIIKLLNISYIPIEQTITLYVSSNSTSTPTASTSISTVLPTSSASTMPSTKTTTVVVSTTLSATTTAIQPSMDYLANYQLAEVIGIIAAAALITVFVMYKLMVRGGKGGPPMQPKQADQTKEPEAASDLTVAGGENERHSESSY